MKTENMMNGGSYVINPETEEVSQVERTMSREEAAAEEAAAADKKKNKTGSGKGNQSGGDQ